MSYIPVTTTATFQSAVPTGYTTTTNMKFDTIDYVLRVGYKF